jgi:hypothetical protein
LAFKPDALSAAKYMTESNIRKTFIESERKAWRTIMNIKMNAMPEMQHILRHTRKRLLPKRVPDILKTKKRTMPSPGIITRTTKKRAQRIAKNMVESTLLNDRHIIKPIGMAIKKA